jgi:hypothetical protein
MSRKISKKIPPIIYILILYENNIHLKIEKDIYQVFVLIKDFKNIHVPNYILLFAPHLRVCVLHQHSRICVKTKNHRRKETMRIDKNCKKKINIRYCCVNKHSPFCTSCTGMCIIATF